MWQRILVLRDLVDRKYAHCSFLIKRKFTCWPGAEQSFTVSCWSFCISIQIYGFCLVCVLFLACAHLPILETMWLRLVMIIVPHVHFSWTIKDAQLWGASDIFLFQFWDWYLIPWPKHDDAISYIDWEKVFTRCYLHVGLIRHPG